MRALITGVTGQDGSYLAELLLAKGYEVFGMTRRSSHPAYHRLANVENHPHLHLVHGDMLDEFSLAQAVSIAQPDEIYNLAAQTFVGTSWTQPALTAEITGLGTLRLLEAARHRAPEARFYQASSSEMFGNQSPPQTEDTPFRPCSPYGAAKVFAHNIAVNYRESYGMRVSCGILFNHESERRGSEFVTKKIARQIAEITIGARGTLVLGNLEARRDWGYAPDYVQAMHLMLQRETPRDYVIASGETHSIQDFIDAAARSAGLPEVRVEIDPRFKRPQELHELWGSSARARRELGWQGTIGFEDLVDRMVQHELRFDQPDRRLRVA